MSKAGNLGTTLISIGATAFITGVVNLGTDIAPVDPAVSYGLVAAGVVVLLVGGSVFLLSPHQASAGTINKASGNATQKVAGRDYYDFGGIKASSASDEEVTPNVVFDGFSPVDDQPIQWHDQRISHATLAEFARVQFVNEPDRRGSSANIDDLHARIDIKDLAGEETLLSVKDGKWFENADRGEGLGRDTKSTNLPCNGETRTLDVVMRPHGLNECHGWDHRGFAIPLPTIPTGEYQVWIELDASTMPERRQFRFLLINPVQVDEHGQIDPGSFITLRELDGCNNPSSREWDRQRELSSAERKHQTIRDAIAAIDSLVDEGNRILDACGRPASKMRGADPMYFIDHCMPKINRFAHDIWVTIRKVAPEYSGKVANIGNVNHGTDDKPAMIQQVERWLVKLEEIADVLRARLP